MRKKEQVIEEFNLNRYEPDNPAIVAGRTLKNTGVVLGFTAAATLVSFALRALGIHESNYMLTYNLGVLFTAYFTNGYVYGILASVLSMLTFNFFFTEPYYTLLAYSPEYPVTFIIMLVVAVITSTLTAAVKRESERAESREKRINILYHIEKNLLAVKSKQQALEVAAKEIGDLMDTDVYILAAGQNGAEMIRHVYGSGPFEAEAEKRACQEAFQSGSPCGAGTELFPQCRAYYYPITGQSGVLGVIGIDIGGETQLSENRKLFLYTVGTQIALVLEREQLYEKQHQTKMEIMRERLRGDLLSAVSHDLRTPLTGIMGSASTVLDNYHDLPDDVKKEFMQGIYDDAEWLNHLVENILNVTRFAKGNIKLVREMEAVEEIVAEAVSRVKKHAGNRPISISIPEELVMIRVDGMLIEQVLVNLLDNAIKYTPENTKVSVYVYLQDGNAVFEVGDEGPGVPKEEIQNLFGRYNKPRESSGDTRRGFGLGLTICKSIVEAHGGTISVRNKDKGGLVFTFALPAGV